MEGGAVVGDVGEVDDGPFVAGELDDEVGEAAGAAGVEEYDRGRGELEPTCCIVAVGCTGDGQAEAAQGGREQQEPVLLQRPDPFGIIGKRSIDATVAFAGAGDALIRGDDVTHAVAGISHRPVIDSVILLIDGGVVHV